MSGVRNEVDDSRSYLQQLLVTVDGAEEEDKALILERAYGEVALKTSKLISDRLASTVVEELFSKSTVDLLEGFLATLTADTILESGMNPFGSHVLEKLLLSLQRLHSTAQEAVERCFVSFATLLEPNSGVLLSEQHATYILRAAIKALGGLEITPRMKKATDDKFVRLYPPSKALRKALAKLYASLQEKLSPEDVGHLAFHQSANPTLQVLFEALPHHKTEVNELAATLLPVEPADATRFSELAQHHVASHLLERILCAVSDDRFAMYYTTYFRHNLAELCERPSPSFVVQQLIANTRDAPQLEMIYSELKDSWPALIQHNRAGVVLRLLEACNKRGILQKKAAKHMQSVVNEVSPREKPFIQKVLEISSTKDPVSGIGSMIAIEVLRSTAPDNRALLESFLSLTAEYIVVMAKSAVGSQVLEAFLGVVQPPKLKKKFIKKLYSHFIELARDKYGSHCLDKLYRHAEVRQKQQIAAELAEDFDNLSKDFYGRFAVRNCRVEAFKRGKEGWQAAETQTDKKRKAFLEIFEKDDTTPLPKRESKGKAKAQQAQQVAVEDTKMSAKAQKIYEALLPAGVEEAEEEHKPAAAEAPPAEDDGFMRSIRSALRGESAPEGKQKKKHKEKRKRETEGSAD